jgi:hypothetical protein
VVRRLLTPTLARPRRLREPMSLTGERLLSIGLKGAVVVALSCLWLKPPPGPRSARSTGTGEGDEAGCAPPRPISLSLCWVCGSEPCVSYGGSRWKQRSFSVDPIWHRGGVCWSVGGKGKGQHATRNAGEAALFVGGALVRRRGQN